MLRKLVVLGQEQIEKGNLRKAKAAFQYLYSKAKQIDDHCYQVTSLSNLAAIYISGEKPEEAVTCLSTVLNLDYAGTNLGDVHYNMAIAHQMLQRNSNAAKEYELALSAYKAANVSSDILSNFAVKVGLFYMKIGKLKKAIDYFNISAKILAERELTMQLATVLCLKARCLRGSDDTVPKAIEVCDECLTLCKAIDQDIFVLQVYNELGLILTQCKAFKKSSQCYKLAVSICDAYDYGSIAIEKKAALMQNLGAVLNTTKKFKEAIEYSQQAADIYGGIGIRSSQCHCFINIAFSFSQIKSENSVEKCEEYYLHALQAAKDTGSLRDQWQSLEGLAGVAVVRGQLSKAVTLYQKAIGICAGLETNNHEQDRLVRKLSDILKMRVPAQNKPSHLPSSAPSPHTTPEHRSTSQLPTGMEVSRVETPMQTFSGERIAPQLHPPLTELSFYRAPNAEASRESFSQEQRKASSASESNRRERKRKRVRRLSRRSDQTPHPIHGGHDFIHQGLGTYKSLEDRSRKDHLSPDQIVNKGNRRRHSGDTASNTSRGLHILGLAVEDPSEPTVGSGKLRGNRYDTLDSANVIRVRPMSSMVEHRRSTLNTGYNISSDDNSLSSDEDIQRNSSEEGTLEDSSCDLEEDEERPNQSYSGKDGVVYHGDNADSVSDALTSDKEQYGSVVSAKERDSNKSVNKGKRPMSDKKLVRKSSFGVKRNTDAPSNGLLDVPAGSDDDEEAVKEHMRRISYLESSDSEEVPPVQSKDNDKQQGVNSQSSSRSESDCDLIVTKTDKKPKKTNKKAKETSEEPRETYEKPKARPVAGGNFFREDRKDQRSEENPLYESIDNAQSTAPQYNAPPQLPPRNYSKGDAEQDEFAETSESESVDVSAMTRGERDRFLYRKQQRDSVKIVKWKGNKEEKNIARKQRSQACSVM